MSKLFLFPVLAITLMITAGSLYAGDNNVTITGNNEEYAGDTLVFLSYSNMVSFAEKELGRCAVDTGGNFECRINLGQIQHIFCRMGIYNCYLYAQPGRNYIVRLPRKREKSMEDLTNPAFKETSVHLSVKATDATANTEIPPDEELNFSIRAFNDAFYPYYYKFVVNAYGNRVDRKGFEQAVAEIREPFDSLEGSFLRSYINYRIGLLEHYGNQVSNKNITKSYFLNNPVFPSNPAYMELFNEIHKDYFLAFAEEHPGARLPVVLNREMDYRKANNILLKEASLKNDTLRELVMLKGLYDGIYDGKNISSSMIQMLDSLGQNSGIDLHQQAVRDIMLEVSRLLPGYKPADFTLYNSDSTLVRLSDFKGQYVYLNFCNSFGYYCIREFEYLRVLHERLSDRLSIVTILVDDSFQNMQELVRSNNYPWTFLHFSRQPEVLDDYDIRSYPYYFLISPTGELILSPAPSPVENFEPTFNRIWSNR